jgi:hypothetical protein
MSPRRHRLPTRRYRRRRRLLSEQTWQQILAEAAVLRQRQHERQEAQHGQEVQERDRHQQGVESSQSTRQEQPDADVGG